MTKPNYFFTIGVDLDFGAKDKKKAIIAKVKRRARRYGTIIKDKPSTNGGHHLRIKLNRPYTFKNTIYARLDLGDDPRRMFYDIMRYWRGSYAAIDYLFDYKEYVKN